MSNCKQCQKELVHIEGRREKFYCDKICKGKWFAKNKPKYIPKKEKLPKGVTALRDIVGYVFDMEQISIEQVEQFQSTHPQKFLRIEALNIEGYNKNPIIKNAVDEILLELRNKVIEHKADYPLTTAECFSAPKNITELRKLMPEGLDSEGRSEWTRINRAKYGI